MANNSGGGVGVGGGMDLLPANLQNSLQEIIDRTNRCGGGIRLILISTAEGVPLGRTYASTTEPSSLNEDVLTDIESTWAPAAKQFPLLNMGKEVKIVTAIYDRGTFICGFNRIDVDCPPFSDSSP